MDIYVMLWVIIQYCFACFDAQTFPVLALERSLNELLYPH